ncbi:MAG: hypothetical protein LUQ11_07945 [Methylococcaceae bacterium]|nr:hypothetical protein [Methylococcaceae bacterium]
MNPSNPDIFSQLHIDVARNSTDDFNLFHDSKKWPKINGNPFNGPISLGFQLESLVEGKIAEVRRRHDEEKIISEHGLNFSNYQFSFPNAVKPGQVIEVEIKESQFKSDPSPTLSNRIAVKADGNLALYGHKKETTTPLFLANADFSRLAELKIQPDRCFLSNGYFLKRKFMMTSNAKNFLCGSLRDQTLYFDELEDKVIFPEMFPCALLSSALLEKALKWNHDFEQNPMVYTSHKISIDRGLLSQLKSNDAVHVLIKPAENSAEHDFGDLKATPLDYECYGLVNIHNEILFRALISLVPVVTIKKS